MAEDKSHKVCMESTSLANLNVTNILIISQKEFQLEANRFVLQFRLSFDNSSNNVVFDYVAPLMVAQLTYRLTIDSYQSFNLLLNSNYQSLPNVTSTKEQLFHTGRRFATHHCNYSILHFFGKVILPNRYSVFFGISIGQTIKSNIALVSTQLADFLQL